MLNTIVTLSLVLALLAIVTLWIETQRQIEYHYQLANIAVDAKQDSLTLALWNSDIELQKQSLQYLYDLRPIRRVVLANSIGELVGEIGEEAGSGQYARVSKILQKEIDGDTSLVGTISLTLDEDYFNKVIYDRIVEVLLMYVATLVVLVVLFALIFRKTGKHITDITNTLNEELIDFNKQTKIPHSQRLDEVGKLAIAIQQFVDKSRELYNLQDMLTFNAIKNIWEVKEVRENMASLNTASSSFLSLMSNQIRTPLTAIQGAVTLCKQGMLGDPKQEALNLLEMAERNCLELENMINAFSELFEMSEGTLVLDIESFDAYQLVLESIESCKSKVMARNQSLKFHEPVSTPFITADRYRLKQVISICIDNVVKHCPMQTHIDVSTSISGKYFRISIVDNGPGIPKKLRSLLFMASNPEKARLCANNGKGVSLGFAHGVMELMGGDILFETFSKDDQPVQNAYLNTGTTFYIDIPVVQL